MASQKLRVHFKCERVPADKENELQIQSVVHFKGFASRISREFKVHRNFRQLVNEYNVIAFDGDDLAIVSFTKYVAFVAAQKINNGENVYLYACKFENELDGFLKSWNDKVCEFSNMSNEDDWEMKIAEVDCLSMTSPVVTLFYSIVDPFSPEGDCGNAKYVYLGRVCLRSTGASTIISCGGGVVVKSEYDQLLQTTDKLYVWHIFPPFSRPRYTLKCDLELDATSILLMPLLI